MRILQVNTRDVSGGAEKMARGLFLAYRQRGHDSRLAVGFRAKNADDVFTIPNARASRCWAAFWWWCYEQIQVTARNSWRTRLLRGAAHRLAEPISWVDHIRGIEDFHFPGTRGLLGIGTQPLDILHCHNLHGDYFDLTALPYLSRRVPVILTPHDAWLLSGHCAHSLECRRWQTGCGSCPDLGLYPAVNRDNTARNWQTKRAIYQDSHLYVTTQSRWLMDKVEHSILAPAIAARRVIPTGIDLSTFRPADKNAARTALNLPQGARVLMFVANQGKRNTYKDYSTLRSAVELIAEAMPNEGILLIALGDSSPDLEVGRVQIQTIPFLDEPALVARYYQAADVYVHAAKADTFPQVILEAMACGVPVVATAICGIPEQVVEGETGLLTPPGDARAMADAIVRVLRDEDLRSKFERQSAERARRYYGADRQTDDYLDYYRWAMADFAEWRGALGHA